MPHVLYDKSFSEVIYSAMHNDRNRWAIRSLHFSYFD